MSDQRCDCGCPCCGVNDDQDTPLPVHIGDGSDGPPYYRSGVWAPLSPEECLKSGGHQLTSFTCPLWRVTVGSSEIVHVRVCQKCAEQIVVAAAIGYGDRGT